MSYITDKYTLDLGDDSNLTLTKSIYDISEPDKRKSHFTKTITVPSSKENDLIFASQFDVNFILGDNVQFEPFFNPSKKAPCVLHTSTIEQMSGYAQMTDIVLNRYTNKVEYKLTLYGEIRDLFGALEDKMLDELNLSKYDHLYTYENITQSWDYFVRENGTLVDESGGGTGNGVGYVYPQVDYGDNHVIKNGNFVLYNDYWLISHFQPWVYVKTIVDAIFAEAGFTYYSDFFDSTIFKKLIYQGDVNGLVKTQDEVEALSINADKTGNTDYSGITNNGTAANAYSTNPIVFDNETLDDDGQYNTSNGETTVSETDQYTLKSNIQFTLTNSSPFTVDGQVDVLIQAIKSNGDVIASVIKNTPIGNSWTAGSTKDDAVIFQEVNLPLNAGDVYKICVRSLNHSVNPGSSSSVINGSVSIRLKLGSTYALIPNSQTSIGANVSVSRLLDPEMSQKEFMMNLVKMFNLYIEPYWFREGDANSGKYNEYLIEPRDDYFTNDVIDWTQNLDTEKDFIIKPSALVDSKFYHFTYKEDGDYLNTLYKGTTGRIYGDYIKPIDNDFAKGTKKIEVSFTPCIMSDETNINHRLMPVNSSQDLGKRVDGKPKVLFYNGTLAISPAWYFNDGLGTIQTMNNYPLAHQLDDVFEPTCDLNWQIPPVIYYGGNDKLEVVFTNGTLYNRYYYRQLLETTDINSKMVECYMRLRPSDVHNLSFRPLYFIKDAYYRLYEMVDHNYSDTTLCRFLKINEATPITNQTTTTTGGSGILIGTPEKTPTKVTIPDDTLSDKWRGVGQNKPVQGTVESGDWKKSASNVLIGGTFVQEVIKPNTVALGFATMDISATTILTGQEGSPIYIAADTSGGSLNILMPSTDNAGTLVVVTKTSASNTLNIHTSGDVLIEALTAAATTEYLIKSSGVLKLR